MIDNTNGTGPQTGFILSKAAEESAAEDEGAVVNLKDLSDKPMTYGADPEKPVYIKVAGSYSSRAIKADEEFTRKTTKVGRRGGDVNEHIATRGKFILAKCVIEWDGLFTDDGKPIPLSESNAIVVFTVAPWIYEQVLSASMDHERFFEKSA